MNSILFIVVYLFNFCTCAENIEMKFDNAIEAVGFPYYKILMSMGDCKGILSNLFEEDKRKSILIRVSLFKIVGK